MRLPVVSPVRPMLAKLVRRLPAPDSVDGGLVYEPKWDGFRCVLFRDGDEVELGSRGERPLTRYFPELVDAARRELPAACVLDGEIVVRQDSRLDFEALQQRVHPAASRIRLLSRETPASFVAFDLLALGDESLMEAGFGERRERLERVLASVPPPFHLTPATDSYDVALAWFGQFEGAGLDGVVAKPLTLPYLQDARVMLKVKHERTVDCVVAGFRWHKSGPVVGSLLLGLYDDGEALQYVGVSASFPMKRRGELVDELAPYRVESLADHPWADWAEQEAGAVDRMPGAINRWSAGKNHAWVPLRPDLVCEVAYDHMEGLRFRHTAQFRRWRPDRDPRSCTYGQLEQPVSYDLADILGER